VMVLHMFVSETIAEAEDDDDDDSLWAGVPWQGITLPLT